MADNESVWHSEQSGLDFPTSSGCTRGKLVLFAQAYKDPTISKIKRIANLFFTLFSSFRSKLGIEGVYRLYKSVNLVIEIGVFAVSNIYP